MLCYLKYLKSIRNGFFIGTLRWVYFIKFIKVMIWFNIDMISSNQKKTQFSKKLEVSLQITKSRLQKLYMNE